ncbi:hypothetical protein V2G26_001666 [Clonostachys chloroleuca]
MATINYSSRDVDYKRVYYTKGLFSRLIQIAERFETAALMVQDAGFYCDSFTVLRFGASSKALTTPEAQLSPIEFSLARRFLRNMKTAVERGKERHHL